MNLKIVAEKKRVVKVEKYITVNGVKFEAMDLYDTLLEMKLHNDIFIVGKDMIQLFKKLKVIEFEGNKDTPATKGKNFDKFWGQLQPVFDTLLWGKINGKESKTN